MNAIHLKHLQWAILILLIGACSPVITNETPERVTRSSTEIYTISADIEPRRSRIVSATAIVNGHRVVMARTSSGDRWEGNYFGGPCIGNVPYSFEVEYNERKIIGSGFSSRVKSKTNPEIGEHVLNIRTFDEDCPITMGKTFIVRNPVDVIDSDLTDGECKTAEDSDAEGECTLRAAVMQANASPGHERIELLNGDYELTLEGDEENNPANAAFGDLDITESLAITGNPGSVTIDGGAKSRIFDVHTSVDNPVVQLYGLRLTNGRENGSPGGAIWNRGALQIRRSLIDTNRLNDNLSCAAFINRLPCNRGAGIFNQGSMLLSESEISDNQTHLNGSIESGHAGAVSNFGENAIAHIEKSLIKGNKARFYSAFQNYLGSMEVVNTTFTGNLEHRGSVISNQGGQVSIRHTTLATNINTSESPEALFGNRNVSINGSTFTGNFRVAGSLIETDDDLRLCSGNIVSGGFNVIRPMGSSGVGSCTFSGLSSSDYISSGFFFSSLFDNGGPTETIAIDDRFPFLDLGSLNCPSEDQRGAIRPVDGDGDSSAQCDPGAFEYNPAGFVRR